MHRCYGEGAEDLTAISYHCGTTELMTSVVQHQNNVHIQHLMHSRSSVAASSISCPQHNTAAHLSRSPARLGSPLLLYMPVLRRANAAYNSSARILAGEVRRQRTRLIQTLEQLVGAVTVICCAYIRDMSSKIPPLKSRPAEQRMSRVVPPYAQACQQLPSPYLEQARAPSLVGSLQASRVSASTNTRTNPSIQPLDFAAFAASLLVASSSKPRSTLSTGKCTYRTTLPRMNMFLTLDR